MSNCGVTILCNFDERNSLPDHDYIEKIWSGDWSINDENLSKELVMSSLNKPLSHIVQNHYNTEEITNKILVLGINSLLSFCEQNWNPYPPKFDLEKYLKFKWPEEIDVTKELQRDSEPIFCNIVHPQLLYLSHEIFCALYSLESNLVNLWWYFRSKVLLQRALEDTSATLFSELELIMAKLSNEMLDFNDKPRLQVLLCLEIAQAYLIYGRIQKVEEYLTKAKEISGLKLELTGVLGKRTKYQQTVLPQLALTSDLDTTMQRPSAEESHGNSALPPDIELQDDVRLNKIKYLEDIKHLELPSLEQTLCLLTVQYLQKSQPRDALMDEELQPYIEAVVSQKTGPWSTRVAALLLRCRLEANHKRSVERAMLQCESIVNDKTTVAATDRLSYLWASGLGPAWVWRHQLADLYRSLGLVKAALELYRPLQLWEDVVVCYTLLQLRHKAAEVIREQLEINPTVKLYCLLGDATDDVSCYEKAWEFSNHKSSRAQRHWGNFLFEHKKYEECIPHYEKSVEINSLQESVWLRLGFAALETKNWETSAKAYRRYTYLQPHSFEAWNNLAKVYVHQGERHRAHRAFLEALRYNYDNWKLWENVVAVSMDTGHHEDVIRGVHRLLELAGRYDDCEVLATLVGAVLHDRVDAEGNGAARLRKRVLELFGRITAKTQDNPDIWQLYSDLSPTYLLKAQRLLKAYRGYTRVSQNGNWSGNPETCRQVIELAQNLLDLSVKALKEGEDMDRSQATQQLSSARLTAQSVLKAAEKQDWPQAKSLLEELGQNLNAATEYMKSVM